MAYIVKNCPAREDIYEWTDDGFCPYPVIDTPNYCVKYKKTCDKVDNCVIKQILEFCKSEYKTPEEFEKITDPRENLIQSCFHNMAHGVLCKFEIEELKDNAG